MAFVTVNKQYVIVGGKLLSVPKGNMPLQDKNVTPTKSTQVVKPDEGFALSKVTVRPIPAEYIMPMGTLNITANGTHNVKKYENVNVNVEGTTGTTGEPIEVATESEMTAILSGAVPADLNKVYKYTGTTGKYENGALYVLETVSDSGSGSDDASGGGSFNVGDAMIQLDTFVDTYIKADEYWSNIPTETQSVIENTDDEKGHLLGTNDYIQYYKECVNLLLAYYSALWDAVVGENNPDEKAAMIAAIEAYRDGIINTEYDADYEAEIANAIKQIYLSNTP